jgi:hypothetical protein
MLHTVENRTLLLAHSCWFEVAPQLSFDQCPLSTSLDIYEDTVARTDARSDAYKFAEIMGGTPKCWGSTWGGIFHLYFSTSLPLPLYLCVYV